MTTNYKHTIVFEEMQELRIVYDYKINKTP